MKVLYVEDDPIAVELVSRGLRDAGYDVDAATTLRSARERASGDAYDLIVLDRALPDGDGIEIVRALRKSGDSVPVLFLSARGEPSDRIHGLQAGADDYLAKPFAFGELIARIGAVARRSLGRPDDGVLRVADLALDTVRRTVSRGGRALALTGRQFELLSVLAQHVGRPLSRSMILERVWGHGFETRSNPIDVHIKELRRKVDDPFDRPLLHTVKGVGYVLEARDPDVPDCVAP